MRFWKMVLCKRGEKMKQYFISYAHRGGFGNADVSYKYKIRSFDDLQEIKKKLEENGRTKDVIILQFIEMELKSKNRDVNQVQGVK